MPLAGASNLLILALHLNVDVRQGRIRVFGLRGVQQRSGDVLGMNDAHISVLHTLVCYTHSCVCVRARARARACVRVRACVCVCVRACIYLARSLSHAFSLYVYVCVSLSHPVHPLSQGRHRYRLTVLVPWL